MDNVTFVYRGWPRSHRILNIIMKYLEDLDINISQVNIVSFFSLLKFKCSNSGKLIIISDPIAFFVFSIFFPLCLSRSIFISFEMYEYQVDNRGFRKRLRNLIFKICHFYSLYFCSMAVFSNDLRKKFYIEKFRWLKRKSYVLENYFSKPMGLSSDEHVDEVVLENVSRFSEGLEGVAIYAGAIQDGRGLREVIDAFESDAHKFGLVVCGPGGEYISNSKKVLSLGLLNFSTLEKVYNFCKIGILKYGNNPLNVKFSAPVKIYEYLHYNLIVISNDNYSMKLKNDLISYYFSSTKDLVDSLKEISADKFVKAKPIEDFDMNSKLNDLFREMGINEL